MQCCLHRHHHIGSAHDSFDLNLQLASLGLSFGRLHLGRRLQ